MIDRGRAIRWAITAVTVVLLVMFARTVDWHHTWASIRHASPGLLGIAIAINLLSLVAKGVRWWVFLSPVSSISLWQTVRATIAGAGLNNILVANGGDVARAVFVARHGSTAGATVAATLAVERLFDVVGYVVLFAFAGLFLTLPPQLEVWTYPAAIALVALIAFLIFLVRSPTKTIAVGAAAMAEASPSSLLTRAKMQLAQFATAARSVSNAPRFGLALILSTISWLSQLYSYHFVALSAGEPISQTGSLACLLAVNLGLIIRATPGNVGFFQFIYAMTAAYFGVPKAGAIGVAFLIQASQIIPVTLLAMILVPDLVFRRSRSGSVADSIGLEPVPSLKDSLPR